MDKGQVRDRTGRDGTGSSTKEFEKKKLLFSLYSASKQMYCVKSSGQVIAAKL